MISVDEARARILSNLRPSAVETVALAAGGAACWQHLSSPA